ncbi:hypothetical protein NG798_16785 [Ancylothrix sp. C2]|uniref:slr1601 family putative cell division protein n=1 Tax=Ancylothrix sp. D3o TaxID=2953691 RepID=UPI0021BB587B|nr:hypothetical protein [Ancylothrix sp. D3o]MCT7951460.1 hypothetical protein [Ancylothrix sp. D3o]
MTAIQPSRELKQPAQKSRVRTPTKARRKQRSNPHVVIATETTLKLAVNVVLSIVAVTALVKLLPHNRSGQEKLQQIQTEVKQTEDRVKALRADFNRSFDPQQAKTIMQEHSHRTDPEQLQVIWLENQKTPDLTATPPTPEMDF